MSVLHAEGVSFSYGASAALLPVDLSVQAGDSIAIVGRSGAGKSTLAEILLGLKRPGTGSVRVGGGPWADPRHRPPRAARRLVQGVPQDAAASFLPRVSLRRQIERAVARLAPEADPRERLAHAARLAQLDPDLLDRRPREVSGGQAQRAAIARALAVQPAVLVADEPTSALDADTSRSIADALLGLTESSGVALILVTHDQLLAQRCGRIVTLLSCDPQGAAEPTSDQRREPAATPRSPQEEHVS